MAGNFRRFMDSAADSTTLLGEGTRFVGQFSGRGHFVVCGEVEGDCEIEGSLTIAVDGRWNGTIRAENVVIAGQVHGEVQASGQLEVAASARITGSLTGASIAIAEGAIVGKQMYPTRGMLKEAAASGDRRQTKRYDREIEMRIKKVMDANKINRSTAIQALRKVNKLQ